MEIAKISGSGMSAPCLINEKVNINNAMLIKGTTKQIIIGIEDPKLFASIVRFLLAKI